MYFSMPFQFFLVPDHNISLSVISTKNKDNILYQVVINVSP